MLPFEVHYLNGGELPAFYGNKRFMPEEGFAKVLSSLKAWMGTPVYAQHEKAVEQYLLEHKIELVYANYSITALPFLSMCRRNKIPLIVHFRGWTAYRSTILEQHGNRYPELFDTAAAVVCVSQDMKRQLMSLGCSEEKLSVIASGANTGIFAYHDCSNNQNIFLSAGRFCDTKNPHLTILAFSKALQQLPDARLVMIGGEENLLGACINLAKALKIEDKIEFRGVVSQQELYVAMQQSCAFVQHSATTNLKEKEGTPNSIMEACAAGLPVVATRHAGILDVIVEEETGLLCDEYDVDTMAQNMVRVATDRTLAKRLGAAASKRVNELFTTQQYIEKVTAVINKALVKKL